MTLTMLLARSNFTWFTMWHLRECVPLGTHSTVNFDHAGQRIGQLSLCLYVITNICNHYENFWLQELMFLLDSEHRDSEHACVSILWDPQDSLLSESVGNRGLLQSYCTVDCNLFWDHSCCVVEFVSHLWKLHCQGYHYHGSEECCTMVSSCL